MRETDRGARASRAADPLSVSLVLMMLFRIYMNGGAMVLAVVVFLATGSLWSLLLLVPWFLAARLLRQMGG